MDRRESKRRSVSYRGSFASRLGSSRTNSQVLASNEGTPWPAHELEACELIVGMDFTKSNNWNGRETFQGRSLHDINGSPNPYIQALQQVKNLTVLDDDAMIPCYGFGDCSTGQEFVFSFRRNNEPVQGLEALVETYKQIVPAVNMSGPTTFAPLIRQAMRDVHKSGMKLHVLLILADGQISGECMEETERALSEAALFPLSILMIGVGDGPWDEMEKFDNECLSRRTWDNFQFINFNDVTTHADVPTGSNRGVQFEAQVISKIQEHCRLALQRRNKTDDDEIRQLVNSIPSTFVIDPPSSRHP